ncbi:MAG: deoxyribodipyrimidine photo-lyase [Paracoccaceae bacterium]
MSPTLVWFRRDLRVTDHPALTAACTAGPVIPVFICDDSVTALGAAPKWRLQIGLEQFAKSLQSRGNQLILRKGDALHVLQELIAQTGAKSVFWSRLYDPEAVERDTKVKAALKQQGIEAKSFGGHLMFEPWSTQTKTGGFYKVYTPFWKSLKDRDVEIPLPAPGKIPGPNTWPDSDDLHSWQLGRAMNRGADVVRPFVRLGETAAQDRLAHFIETIVAGYGVSRDRPDQDGTSGLSENLALGEISPHQCWHAGMRAHHDGKPGAETFLKELVWREFAYHLMHHTPQILTDNWKPDWDKFAWNSDPSTDHVQAWMQGRTGLRFVDAALREMYVTGRMHNRGRMIVASYLTKHLLTDWKIGLKWFEDCLIDWDPASNAMGWQWSAGSGPDATPYFRVFNPTTQLDKFDPQRAYVDRWIGEGKRNPAPDALRYFDAIPRSWNMSVAGTYPEPIVPADVGRKRALAAYETRGF